ncbi:MAG: hypothetical protein WC796_06190 [Candidatus Pacearchaeota archaeon]|jgi:hypothetical protein
MQKKGISDVIVTVLMILLVVAAIAIIWAVLANFLNRGTQDVETTADCMNTNLKVVSAVSAHGATVSNITGTIEHFSGNANINDIAFFVNGARVTTGLTKTIPSTGETMPFMIAYTGDVNTAGGTLEIAAVIGSNVCNIKSARFTIG